MAEDFDFSEVHKLAVDLGKGTAATVKGARAILNTAAMHIKRDMIKDARASAGKHAKRFPSSITYDLMGLSAEIGPDKNRPQGALGNLLYFGSANNGPVITDFARGLKKEAPIFEKLLADLAAGAIFDPGAGGGSSAPLFYTTKSGKTREASQAQIDNWTKS